MLKKTCKKCRRSKPIEMYYKHSRMADGHLGQCKSCVKKRVGARYISKHDKIIEYEKKRNQNPERKAKMLLYQKRRRAKYPGKSKARHAVSNAVRDGRITKTPCEICNNPKSEAHHEDYRSLLKVRWLCRKHHREAHKVNVV